MRCLGEIKGRRSAEQFVAHLLVLEIETHIEAIDPEKDQWEIWVKDEDNLEVANREYKHYLNFSSDPKFEAALEKANAILLDREKQRLDSIPTREEPESRTPKLLKGRPRLLPLTTTLLVLCVVVSFSTNFSSPSQTNDFGQTVFGQLSFLAPAHREAEEVFAGASLQRGELWRAITPIFLHINPLHLAVNMFMLVSLGRLVEYWVGTPRYAMMVLVLAIVPNLLQGLLPEMLRGSPDFGGISGVLYGLFGYVWIRTSLNPKHGLAIPLPIVLLLLGLVAFGISGVFGADWKMADVAHCGGLVLGCLIGYWSEQERQEEQVA